MIITDKIIRKHWLIQLTNDLKMSRESYFSMFVWDEALRKVLLIAFDNLRHVL